MEDLGIDLKRVKTFASMDDIFKPILDYLFSEEYHRALKACDDSKEHGFLLGLTMAPSIIWTKTPKMFIKEDDLKEFLGLVENGRVENTNVNEEKV